MGTGILRGVAAGLVWLSLCGAAGAAVLPGRAPGLWQSSTTVSGPDGRPLANANDVVTLSCVDPATDIKFFTSGERRCTKFAITGAGQHFSIGGICRQLGKPVKIQETLDYASAHDVTLNAYLDTASGVMKITSRLLWQGDCPVGMRPGDEGSMVNGAFSKADNIDDSDNR